MRIEWFGHNCFAITALNGTVILTDPLESAQGYRQPEVKPNIVTISHKHCSAKNIKGEYRLIDKMGKHAVLNMEILAFPSFHDNMRGRLRGENLIFAFDVGGLKICHLGDVGHEPDKQIYKYTGQIDILMIPVNGKSTIGAMDADNIINTILPRVVIPMNFKTKEVASQIDTVEKFTAGKQFVERPGVPYVEITQIRPSPKPKIIVLNNR